MLHWSEASCLCAHIKGRGLNLKREPCKRVQGQIQDFQKGGGGGDPGNC